MLAVIGGSGFYALDGLEIASRHDVDTPFGKPSGEIVEGAYLGQRLLFLARHGAGHRLLPHEVNYRANIFALKMLGARRIFSLSAAGSLREDIRPGDLAMVAQYFDHTRGKRYYSFFGNGVAAHISTAHPACPALSHDIARAAERLGQPMHVGKTYACVEGPRLGTQAESFYLRDAARCDVVGMTNVPEAFLAREAQIAYCTVCLVTDYDCWMDDPAQHVSVSSFLEVYAASVAKGRALLAELVRAPFSETPAEVRSALKDAVLTPDHAIAAEHRAWLDVLRA